MTGNKEKPRLETNQKSVFLAHDFAWLADRHRSFAYPEANTAGTIVVVVAFVITVAAMVAAGACGILGRISILCIITTICFPCKLSPRLPPSALAVAFGAIAFLCIGDRCACFLRGRRYQHADVVRLPSLSMSLLLFSEETNK